MTVQFAKGVILAILHIYQNTPGIMLTQNMYYTSGVDRTGAEFVGNKQNHSHTRHSTVLVQIQQYRCDTVHLIAAFSSN